MKNKDLRDKIVKILDLEVSPDGKPEYLLIRDENNRVTEGIPMENEVMELLNLWKEEAKKIIKNNTDRLDQVDYDGIAKDIIKIAKGG